MVDNGVPGQLTLGYITVTVDDDDDDDDDE